MKLEQQVCSLELAKWLKEAGVKQKSAFVWCDCDVHGQYQLVQFEPSAADRRICAFTVAELGEMLPTDATVRTLKHNGKWYVDYHKPNSGFTFPGHREESATSQADAVAKMLIYLLENKLIAV